MRCLSCSPSLLARFFFPIRDISFLSPLPRYSYSLPFLRLPAIRLSRRVVLLPQVRCWRFRSGSGQLWCLPLVSFSSPFCCAKGFEGGARLRFFCCFRFSPGPVT